MRVSEIFTASAIVAVHLASALELHLDDPDSIKSAAKAVASDLVTYIKNQTVPGLLPAPYYWWEGSVLYDSLINYWFLTGDDQYNNQVTESLLFQVGPEDNYMPLNQTKTLGNDDQAMWGLAALTAAERGFPDPPADKPQWIDLATAVFDSQTPRWDDSCGGGLRWQIFQFSSGYNYKEAQTFFFLLAARLTQYTGNKTYSEWAEKAYNWTSDVLMDKSYAVYDGADVQSNCSTPNHIQWSHYQAGFLYGSAIMYNLTSSDTWRSRVEGHLSQFKSVFFYNDTILYEVACERNNNCDVDQRVFKSLTARWMAQAVVSAPFISNTIYPLLGSSAEAAAATCTGGDSGNFCGMTWTTGKWDSITGIGEQLNALEVIQQNLDHGSHSVVTNTTGNPSSSSTTSSSTAAVTSTTNNAATPIRPGLMALAIGLLSIAL